MSVTISINPGQFPLASQQYGITSQNPDGSYNATFLWSSKGQAPNTKYYLQHTTGNITNCDQIGISLAEVQKTIKALQLHAQYLDKKMKISPHLYSVPQKIASLVRLGNYYTALLILHDCLK